MMIERLSVADYSMGFVQQVFFNKGNTYIREQN